MRFTLDDISSEDADKAYKLAWDWWDLKPLSAQCIVTKLALGAACQCSNRASTLTCDTLHQKNQGAACFHSRTAVRDRCIGCPRGHCLRNVCNHGRRSGWYRFTRRRDSLAHCLQVQGLPANGMLRNLVLRTQCNQDVAPRLSRIQQPQRVIKLTRSSISKSPRSNTQPCRLPILQR